MVKYYEIMVSANNAVGANFYYVIENEKDSMIEQLEQEEDNILGVDEITKSEYNHGLQRNHRRAFHAITGYYTY